MKLRAIGLANVRRFADPVRIDGIGTGLNVLCAPNEAGKSTLFDAVQALFFKPHRSRDKDVMALQPHAGGGPEVTVEVETAGGVFTIGKRWIARPEARVMQNGRLIAQADAAEAWIAACIGGSGGRGAGRGAADGLAGLVWVRQGCFSLDGGPPGRDPGHAARQDLLSSVAGEVEQVTGGRRMDRAVARCTAELAELATASGKPRAGGPWKAAQDRVAELAERRDRLQAAVAAMRDALDQRRRCRRELAALTDPDEVAARSEALARAREALAAARSHAEQVERQAAVMREAEYELAATTSRRQTLRDVLAELGHATELQQQTTARADAAGDRVAGAQAAFDTAAAALSAALEAERRARDAFRRAELSRQAREGAARRRDLESQLARAEAARARMEQARAAQTGPDARRMAHLDQLAGQMNAAAAARDIAAPRITWRPDSERVAEVALNGMPLQDGVTTPILGPSQLVIAGVGVVDIRPGSDGAGSAQVDRAAAALRAALDEAGLPDLDAARRAAAAHADAMRAEAEARMVLQALAPDGLEDVRSRLAAIPVPSSDDATGMDCDPDAAERRLTDATDRLRAAQAAHDAAVAVLSEARAAAAASAAAATAAADRLGRASAAVARETGDGTNEAALDDRLGRQTVSLTAARAALEQLRRDSPDLDVLTAAADRARSVDDAARAEIARLQIAVAGFDQRIASGAGAAIEDDLARTEAELSDAQAELGRIEQDVAVLTRLRAALDTARTEARDRYFAPVAAELRPLLQRVWPDAELTWDDDTLLPRRLIRAGHDEPVDILSGGTREQLALLVRLAFARMMGRAGRPAPVILDDALVFTDDERIEQMFLALHGQARDMQILVLSCRQRAFRGLGGRILRIERGPRD